MAHDDVAFVDQAQAVLGHLVGLGREAGDQVGADRDLRPLRLQPRHRLDRVCARLWRRFIRFRTMSSPAWKLMWRCGMKRGSPVASSNSRSSISMQSSEERRRRGSSGTWLQDALDQLPERRRAGQVRAVAGDVDAGQHDLAEAFVRPAP